MHLTDAQVTAIIHASRPLQAHEQTAFLTALAALLAWRNKIGDGQLWRVLRDLQREYFVPPPDAETGRLEVRHKGTAAPGDRINLAKFYRLKRAG
jgi:hypothetical protein